MTYTPAEFTFGLSDSANNPIDSFYTKTEGDAKYALTAGYTSSGAINMNSNSFSNVINVGFTGAVNALSAATEDRASAGRGSPAP